jgi:hypothetical protein
MKFQDEGPKLRKRYAKKADIAESSDEEDTSSEKPPSDLGIWEFPIISTQSSSPPDPFEALECVAPPLFEPKSENGWEEMIGLELVSNQEASEEVLDMDAEEVFEDPDLALGKGYLAEFIKGESGSPTRAS